MDIFFFFYFDLLCFSEVKFGFDGEVTGWTGSGDYESCLCLERCVNPSRWVGEDRYMMNSNSVIYSD